MFKILKERLKQKYQTIAFPKKEPVLSKRFHGLPIIDPSINKNDFQKCQKACPTQALEITNDEIHIDLGKCIFCQNCSKCSQNKISAGKISFSQNYQLSASIKKDLLFNGKNPPQVQALKKEILKLFGRSLRLRQVSAGGCNGCELDVNVLNTVVFDLSRFGIQFVASPRHADGLLITGPVTKNMELALKKTYDAVSDPKIVIAVGACAISGGIYRDHKETCNGADSIVPVDLYVPGCPPHPITILDGILKLLKRK